MPPPGACPDPGIEPVSAALARIPSKWLDSGDRGHASFLIVEGTDSGFIIGRKKKNKTIYQFNNLTKPQKI